MSETPTKQSSGLAIAGLVLGILAAVTSFLPIINNLSAIIAVVGGVLAGVALMGALKGKNNAKGMSIAGVVLAVVSFVMVLATQSMYKAALDRAVESVSTGSQPVATSTSDSEGTQADGLAGVQANGASSETQATSAPTEGTPSETVPSAEAAPAETPAQQVPAEEPAPQKDYLWLAVGESVTLQNGLTLVLNSVQRTLINYDNRPITCVNVTITNGGTSNESFSSYDWKSEDGDGAQRSTSYYSEAENELNSGTLSPGGTVSGNLYFEDNTTRVYYYDNMFNKAPTCGWVL